MIGVTASARGHGLRITHTLRLQFVYHYVFYCPICKNKHKHAVPQTIISEVIQNVIGI